MRTPYAIITATLLFVLALEACAMDEQAQLTIIRDAVERNVPEVELRPDILLIVRAIRKAENGREGFEFGVEHPLAKGYMKQAGWCAFIVRKRWLEFIEEERDEAFIDYLARRYCPVNQKVWAKNVTFFHNKFLEENR